MKIEPSIGYVDHAAANLVECLEMKAAYYSLCIVSYYLYLAYIAKVAIISYGAGWDAISISYHRIGNGITHIVDVISVYARHTHNKAMRQTGKSGYYIDTPGCKYPVSLGGICMEIRTIYISAYSILASPFESCRIECIERVNTSIGIGYRVSIVFPIVTGEK